ncbi:ankyrin repeat domain-containing protein [Sutcliffiella horikoshii]|uniref:Ankyrin repeat domain-containing protein n=1 Tax=Sutcliffiella horikoshii TaxID=79883 RepID=A0A5D4TJZ9_9BACI|nr:ankyrin repeat domain-containing protein [Sutcliffiella horikoshii]TYS74396.1 ankyrin repeat domain-containing protein [Sutcliffiella horikoshii]
MNFVLEDEYLGIEVTKAIQTGDVSALECLLAAHHNLATARIIAKGYHDEKSDAFGVSRTLLHVATDWPGHFPNGETVVRTLVESGAEVNARFTGHHTETPLHWAASSNDVEVLQALLDAGADINATGAVIAEGTPLDDAVAFGQWDAARLLVENGAQTKLWNAAALGMLDEEKTYYADAQLLPSAFETTQAFWLACHGGQLLVADYLFSQGADLNWVGYDGLTPLDAAVRNNKDVKLIEWLHGKDAHSAGDME